MPSTSSAPDADYAAPVLATTPTQEAQLKRKRNPASWQKNVSQKKRNSGEEYISKRKKVIAARKVGAPCTCPKRCFERVGGDEVQLIFDEYWKMADYNTQSSYLSKMVIAKPVKEQRAGQESRRKATFEYGVLVKKERVVVCKTAFLRIHDLGEARVAHVVKAMGDTGVVPQDRRGKAVPPHNKLPDDILQVIHDHVKTLPTCSSHYSRAKSPNKVYLPPGFSHRYCYDLYLAYCRVEDVPEDKKAPSLDVYSRALAKFNIGTAPPKVDTCSYCDKTEVALSVAVDNKDTATFNKLTTELRLHNLKANVAQDFMKTYHDDRDHRVFSLCMDLQQTLATPRMSTNVAYYKRKMWTYNFGIHNLRKYTKSHLYVWNEAIAKRGSSEIGSCLLHYVQHYIPDNVEILVIFSDNCGGQNKNLNISLLLLRLIHSGRFSLIRHYFLVPGHSVMDCDRDFGNLETHFRGRQIYTTEQYVELMREARVDEDKKFCVVEMKRDNFFDLQPLQSLCTKGQVSKAGYKNGRMFKYAADFKQGMKVWQTYNDDFVSPIPVQLQKGRSTVYDPSSFDLTTVDLPLKYPEGVRLKKEKLADLKYLLSYIPLGHKSWYEELFQAQGVADAPAAEDDDPDDPDHIEDDVLDYH